mmetsp:Transcript_64420/g.153678  ORF Transcript_64420/g.153678 Transcript_64420/m.153678 type:complete len:464 (-) Transcript_64420:128-1519(-)
MNISSCAQSMYDMTSVFNVTFASSACGDAIESLTARASSAQDLTWLWRTLAATSCWAISDVICDGCIRPAGNEDGGGEKEVHLEKDALKTEALSSRHMDTTRLGTTKSGKHTTGARQRNRSLPKRDKPMTVDLQSAQCFPASASGKGLSKQAQLRLTPEQNALVSGFVALFAVMAANATGPGYSTWSSQQLFLATSTGEVPGSGSLFQPDSLLAMAMLGGCFHFTAYLATLCAFGAASSTVITPLMQLSAVWMLPLSIFTATIGLAEVIRPIHVAAVGLICVGGFLPAADGSLSTLATATFWRQRAVRYVALGELLICCYNIILHQATFGIHSDSGGSHAISVRFFLLSRLGNGLTCLSVFLAVPSLRQELCSMRQVGRGFLLTAVLGECLSLAGVCLVTFSYSSFYEPSVVNAVEGGLQQLLNLLFALLSSKLLGWGRHVSQVPIKILSFTLVAAGLTLTTL